MPITASLEIEKKFWYTGKRFIAGVDEVGRGCLAGPVVTAAVVFAPHSKPIVGVTDSKQLTECQRATLFPLITTSVFGWSLGVSSVPEIDQLGITKATHTAMERSLSGLGIPLDLALVDGRDQLKLSNLATQSIIKGDQKVYSIAAASIVAKVMRDLLMTRLSHKWPQYHWQQNKGYGTLVHRLAIRTMGPSPLHRQLFIRNCLSEVPI